MEITATEIKSDLDKLSALPARVSGWEVETGLDAADEPAVWVWALLEGRGGRPRDSIPPAGYGSRSPSPKGRRRKMGLCPLPRRFRDGIDRVSLHSDLLAQAAVSRPKGAEAAPASQPAPGGLRVLLRRFSHADRRSNAAHDFRQRPGRSPPLSGPRLCPPQHAAGRATIRRRRRIAETSPRIGWPAPATPARRGCRNIRRSSTGPPRSRLRYCAPFHPPRSSRSRRIKPTRHSPIGRYLRRTAQADTFLTGLLAFRKHASA